MKKFLFCLIACLIVVANTINSQMFKDIFCLQSVFALSETQTNSVLVNEVYDNYIAENFSDNMTTEEKIGKICAFPAQYNYDSGVSYASAMIMSGGGDCFASTYAIIELASRLGLYAWVRDASNDYGASSNHINAVVECDGDLYILDAGYEGKAPRYYTYYKITELFEYIDRTDGIEVFQYIGNPYTTTEIIIPNQINGKPVVAIGDYAFDNQQLLKDVYLPNTIISIGNRAFNSCEVLENIELSQSLKLIGDYAFAWCKNLKNINFPDSLEEIGKFAFKDCTGFTKINIPDSVDTIKENAFEGCTNLASIKLPVNLKTISFGMFDSCKNLVDINLPSSIIYIEDNAFAHCNELAYIKLPNDLKELGDYAFCDTGITRIEIPYSVTALNSSVFSSCSKLSEIIMPDTITSIGSYAFYDCQSLNDIDFPSQLEEIGDNAFISCKNFENIVLPNKLKNIGISAFEGCTNLENISVPESVEYIGECAFNFCSSLKEFEIPPLVTSLKERTFYGCDSITSLKIPGTVKTIDSEACEYMENLTNLMIEEGVEEIGEFAFYNNPMIKNVTIPSSVKSIGKSAFSTCKGIEIFRILNTKCFIYDTSETICNTIYSDIISIDNSLQIVDVAKFSGTLCGLSGSTTELYAKKYGYDFISIGNPSGSNKICMADIIMMQKYLLGCEEISKSQMISMDLNFDGIVDVFDMVLMRKEIINSLIYE